MNQFPSGVNRLNWIMQNGSRLSTVKSNGAIFNRIYIQAIHPGIETANMEPVRANEERVGGIIHKPMSVRLLLCDYAVVDLTTGNPSVFYYTAT